MLTFPVQIASGLKREQGACNCAAASNAGRCRASCYRVARGRGPCMAWSGCRTSFSGYRASRIVCAAVIPHVDRMFRRPQSARPSTAVRFGFVGHASGHFRAGIGGQSPEQQRRRRRDRCDHQKRRREVGRRQLGRRRAISVTFRRAAHRPRHRSRSIVAGRRRPAPSRGSCGADRYRHRQWC